MSDRRGCDREEKRKTNSQSKSNFPDSVILLNDDELVPSYSVCGPSERGQGRLPGAVYVGVEATQCRPVARLVLSESEGLSALLSQCSSYCKGNESSIRLFIQ